MAAGKARTKAEDEAQAAEAEVGNFAPKDALAASSLSAKKPRLSGTAAEFVCDDLKNLEYYQAVDNDLKVIMKATPGIQTMPPRAISQADKGAHPRALRVR